MISFYGASAGIGFNNKSQAFFRVHTWEKGPV